MKLSPQEKGAHLMDASNINEQQDPCIGAVSIDFHSPDGKTITGMVPRMVLPTDTKYANLDPDTQALMALMAASVLKALQHIVATLNAGRATAEGKGPHVGELKKK
jgi:hypothetical protein